MADASGLVIQPPPSQTQIKAYVTDAISGLGFVLQSQLPDFTQYASHTEVTNALVNAVTPSQAQSAISSALAGYPNQAAVQSAIATALAPYETQAQFAAGTASFQSASQVTTAIASALATYQTAAQIAGQIAAAIPPPDGSFCVPATDISATSVYLYQRQIDRAMVLKGFYVALTGITGASAALKVQLQKNGVAQSADRSLSSTSLTGQTILGSNVNLSAGDVVSIVQTGLTVSAVPGALSGFLMLAYP